MNAYMTISQHEETGLFHGLVYRNHPTPSGCDRWLLSLSTNEGFATQRLAGEYMNSQFTELPSFDLDKLDPVDYLATLPALPEGAEVILMDYNPRSYEPSPEEQFPIIEVRYKGVKQNIKLSSEHLVLLIQMKKVELDSFNDDPNLSCTYRQYFVKSAESCATLAKIAQ